MRAYSVPIGGIDAVIVLTGMSFIFLSFAIRVFIFMRLRDDSAIEKQLSNASIIGFGDFLALRLWRLRHNMSARAKFPVGAFFYLQVVGAMLLTGGIAHATMFN